ncbi:hypothetical protein [Pedococcus sp. 5OH_020]|uniref:hypothetical protein n=1 Tax=Pedococcus sp. 5OH_020 TaxID=2989814 RepID=UPI0022E9A07C|nr:hypothetical protein [Pedococcus sp. 5OH_020]
MNAWQPSTARNGTPAAPWPSRAVRLATHALPAGATRDRYRQEFLAELAWMPERHQARHAAGILSHSLALGSALRGSQPTPLEHEMTRPTKPLLCKTNVHHSWEWATTRDGQRYVRCAHCLKERGQWTGGASMGSFGAGGG